MIIKHSNATQANELNPSQMFVLSVPNYIWNSNSNTVSHTLAEVDGRQAALLGAEGGGGGSARRTKEGP